MCREMLARQVSQVRRVGLDRPGRLARRVAPVLLVPLGQWVRLALLASSAQREHRVGSAPQVRWVWLDLPARPDLTGLPVPRGALVLVGQRASLDRLVR